MGATLDDLLEQLQNDIMPLQGENEYTVDELFEKLRGTQYETASPASLTETIKDNI